MKRWFSHPLLHGCLLLAISAGLVFPQLGATTLWDDDEGVNAECAREMREAGTVVIPTFNWHLRTAKPILLYWMLLGTYELFGVNEWSARLPSALMFLFITLLTYDLARRMFDKTIGFLAGLIVASCLQICVLGHACTTDATLIAFTVLYIWGLWIGTRAGCRSWYIPTAIASALATLAKGPTVGLFMLTAIAGLWLWWHGKLGMLRDRRMGWSCLVWALIAVPWYALVAAESHGEWPKAFFLNENIGRAAASMEEHGGIPVVYELIVVCLLFAPWCVFLYITIRMAVRELTPLAPGGRGAGGEGVFTSKANESTQSHRLLMLWILVYFVACAAARTKLPHYIAPCYPALAILTAVFLVRWMRGEIKVAEWVIPAATFGIGFIGALTIVVCLTVGGKLHLSSDIPVYPEFAKWWWLGLIMQMGCLGMIASYMYSRRDLFLVSVTSSSLVFMGILAAYPMQELEKYKAPKRLVEMSGARQLDREINLGSYEYSQPSLVYYAGRAVVRLNSSYQVARWLEELTPRFLFVPEDVWAEQVLPEMKKPVRIVAEHYDFFRSKKILVVSNQLK